jgi:hypothetical protein
MAEDKRKAEATEEQPELDAVRRAALAKMGRFAGYTAPVMLALLGATKARAQPEGSGEITCWVARAVYGPDNPAWLEFRAWLLGRAPAWLQSLYIAYGPRLAPVVARSPWLKAALRPLMDRARRSVARAARPA